MKIIKKDGIKSVLFGDVKVGDIFLSGLCQEDGIYIKTPWLYGAMQTVNAVNLEDGEYSCYTNDEEVFLFDYKFQVTI